MSLCRHRNGKEQQPTKQLQLTTAAHRLAAVLSLALAFAIGEAWATDRTWNGGTGGTEAAPLDIYNAGNWNPSGLPTTSDRLIFATTASTVVTNGFADGATTQISGDWYLKSGDWTFLGPAKFPTLENQQNSGDITVVKKGDWTLTYAMYLCRSGNTMTFTNYGKVTHTPNNRWFQIGNGGNGPCVFENISGDWNVAGAFSVGDACKNTTFNWRSGNISATRTDQPFYIGRNISASGVVNVAKDAGDWTLQGGLLFNHGAGTFDHNGGTTTVASDKSTTLAGYSGAVSTLKLNGGTFKTKEIVRGNAGGTAELVFNGGELVANAASANGLVAAGVSVSAGALGGTINAGNLDVVIVPSIGGEGAMTFKGGGGVTLSAAPTYTGATTVEVGTTLIVPSAIAGNKLTFTIPESLDKGVYDVVRVSEGVFADDVLTDATRPQDANAQFRLNSSKMTIVCIYGYEPGEVAYIGGSGGSLSVADNWTTGVVPTSGNETFDFAAATTIVVGDVFSPDTLTIPESSAVVTLAGSLTVSALTNACKLAVADGSSLTVTGDLVGYAATNDPKPLLYSNHGTVTVGGKVHFRSNGTSGGNSIVYQYAVADADSKPIAATGLAYNADSWSDYLVANLGSMDNGSGKWVVGAAGLTIPYSRNIDRSGFRVTGSQSATLHSSADWTLAESYRHKGNDLLILDTATVTIDTADWNGGSVGHTVTLKGYVNAKGTAASPLSVTGNGKVVLAAVPANDNTNIVNGVLSVASGATLEIESGVDVAGTGTISLAAGAILSLPANADRTFTTRDIIPVTLSAEGTATLRIDGDNPLKGDDDILFGNVPTGYADHLTVTGTAIEGRKATLTDDGENLILSVQSPGLMVIFR